MITWKSSCVSCHKKASTYLSNRLDEENELQSRIEMLEQGQSIGPRTVDEYQRMAAKNAKKDDHTSHSSLSEIGISGVEANNYKNSEETSVLSGLSQ